MGRPSWETPWMHTKSIAILSLVAVLRWLSLKLRNTARRMGVR